jgi:hypothetical protein
MKCFPLRWAKDSFYGKFNETTCEFFSCYKFILWFFLHLQIMRKLDSCPLSFCCFYHNGQHFGRHKGNNLYENTSLHTNPLARSPGQVKLDSEKWKLWEILFQKIENVSKILLSGMSVKRIKAKTETHRIKLE